MPVSQAKTDSWNHAMDGHIDAWFFEHVGGLKSTALRNGNGYGHSALELLAPQPVDGVSWAEVSRSVPGGGVTMRWEHKSALPSAAAVFEVIVAVPPSSSGGDGASVQLSLPTSRPEVKHALVSQFSYEIQTQWLAKTGSGQRGKETQQQAFHTARGLESGERSGGCARGLGVCSCCSARAATARISARICCGNVASRQRCCKGGG